MKLLGYTDLAPITPEEAATRAREFITMPIWPAEGSVKKVGDVTLVRLGQKPGLVQEQMMEELHNLPSLRPEDILFQ